MKKPVKRVRRYADGGGVSGGSGSSGSSGSGSTGDYSGSTSSGTSGYYNMMSQLRGNLGGSRESPYSNTQGGNAYFSKGGKVRAKAKPKRKR